MIPLGYKKYIKEDKWNKFNEVTINKIENITLLERKVERMQITPQIIFEKELEGQKLLNLIFKDLLILDWDEEDGIEKKTVSKIIKIFLSDLQTKCYGRIRKKDMCFKLYETDHGVHGFLVSHRLSAQDEDALQIKNALCTDFKHNVLCYNNDNMCRISKKHEKDIQKEFQRKEFIKDEIIQKEGVNGKIYIGNKNNIDPVLERYTNLIIKAQEFYKTVCSENIVIKDIAVEQLIIFLKKLFQETLQIEK
jgi:hypothetical protein